MMQSPLTAKALATSLAIGASALNSTSAEPGTAPKPDDPPVLKLPQFQAIPLLNDPFPCPPDREVITEKDPKGFSATERARINSAVHILEVVIPDAPWVARARKIEWVALTADSQKFADQTKAQFIMGSPVTYLRRHERVLFNLNGKNFEEKEYLLVPSPAKRDYSPVEFAVVLSYWIANQLNSRDVLKVLDSRVKMYTTQSEVAKAISNAIGRKILIDEATAVKWKHDLDRLYIEGRWLACHNSTNRELMDCCLTLQTISKDQRLLEQNPELAKGLDAVKERILAWQKVNPNSLNNADDAYNIGYMLNNVSRMIKEKDPNAHKELQEKISRFGLATDNYSDFLVQITAFREQRLREIEKQENAAVPDKR